MFMALTDFINPYLQCSGAGDMKLSYCIFYIQIHMLHTIKIGVTEAGQISQTKSETPNFAICLIMVSMHIKPFLLLCKAKYSTLTMGIYE